MNKQNLNMHMIKKHIDQATPKKMTKKERLVFLIESIAIVMLLRIFIFLFLISDIIENYFLGF